MVGKQVRWAAYAVGAAVLICAGLGVYAYASGIALRFSRLLLPLILTAVSVPMIVSGFYMAATGKGAWAISGFNTMSKAQKAAYDVPRLARDTGLLVVLIMLPLLVGGVGYACLGRSAGESWLMAAMAITFVIAVAAICVMNMPKTRYLLDPTRPPARGPSMSARKKFALAAVVILLVAGVGVGIYCLEGYGSVSATAADDGLHVSAPGVGETVAYGDMQSVELRTVFDPGSRVSGFAGSKVISGHWENDELGSYILAAYVGAPAWIVIGRSGDDLVIGLSDAAAAAALYAEIEAHRAA